MNPMSVVLVNRDCELHSNSVDKKDIIRVQQTLPVFFDFDLRVELFVWFETWQRITSFC